MTAAFPRSPTGQTPTVTTNPMVQTCAVRLIGRRGKGGGHGMMAGGWVDAGKVAAADRVKLQRQLGVKLARELKKSPEKMSRLDLQNLEQKVAYKVVAERE